MTLGLCISHLKGHWKKGSMERITSSPALQTSLKSFRNISDTLLGLHSLGSILSCSEANPSILVPTTRTCSLPPGSGLALSVQVTGPSEEVQDVSCHPLRQSGKGLWTSNTQNMPA